ncbi:ABZJ_00895 family protein [Arenibacterium sp. LLYu02]|uniref:ABZJ_00895 family protein n=1 Tax=Arenibacterium sp. LLYu02 TaxID=3404132 RepID=UPI003B216C1C
MNLRRFSLVYLAIMMGLMVIVVLVQAIFAFDIANAGMAILPSMGAAMAEGQSFARREARLPSSSEMWGFARKAGVLILGFTMISVAVFSVAAPQIKAMMSDTTGALVLMGAILFQAAVSFVLVRHFVGLGAKSMLKAKG